MARSIFELTIVMQQELRANETILHVAHRHGIVLFTRQIIPSLVLGICLSLIWYRMSQPFNMQPLDTITMILIGIALLTLLLMFYLYKDWEKDQIVLTDQRVIYNVEKPLVRRTQEQLPINDIHQVEAETETYLEHWLKYGTIKVQSASFTHPMIFRAMSHPQRFQNRIMNLVHSLKQDQADVDDFRNMVNRRVYHDEPPEPASSPSIRQSRQPHILHWLFHENPHYDHESQTYIWHPHWFFLLKALVKPGALMLLIVVLSLTSAELNLITEIWMISLLLGIGLIAIGWAAWEIEDHRNDRYILSPSQVIDIEKQPFGPENQSSASLDSIQNTTYTTTLFSRIIGYGDVWLELAGSGDRLTFYDVPRPRDMVSVIDSYQGAFNRSQKERNLEDTLRLLHAYHELQQEQHDAPAAAGVSPHSNGYSNGHARQADAGHLDQQSDASDAALLQNLLHAHTESSNQT